MNSKKITKVDPQIIDGKPYFGMWMGKTWIINGHLRDKPVEEVMKEFQDKIFYTELEVRHCNIVYRPPYNPNPQMSMNATVGAKYVVWGRAWKVMHLFKAGKKQWKKVWLNGRRKRVRK
jgi:hypothetical protein